MDTPERIKRIKYLRLTKFQRIVSDLIESRKKHKQEIEKYIENNTNQIIKNMMQPKNTT